METFPALSSSSTSAPTRLQPLSSAPLGDDELAKLSLSPEGLCGLMQEKQELVVLDLRSFMQYNQCNIMSSINVCIPSALLKRKNFSLTSVESAIGCDKSREKFKNRQGADVVCYDTDGDSIKKNCLLSTVLQKLKDESLVTSIYFLTGGFQTFATKFPQYCRSKDASPTTSLNGLSIHSSLNGSLNHLARSLGCQQHLQLSPLHTPNHDSTQDKEPVEIFDYLFVGGQDVSSNLATLQRYNLTYILNAAKEVPDFFTDRPELHYLRLDLLDCATQDLDLALFERAFKFIDEARANKQKVLVHCRAGQSRSATIVISYIIHSQRWSLQQAYKFVQGKRPSVSPNLGFIAQLLRFETAKLGTATAIHQLISSPSDPLPPSSTKLAGDATSSKTLSAAAVAAAVGSLADSSTPPTSPMSLTSSFSSTSSSSSESSSDSSSLSSASTTPSIFLEPTPLSPIEKTTSSLEGLVNCI